jgi:DNA-binding NarL/FixJ family response regulator
LKERQKIVIAEDYTILREGLRAILSSDSELEVVGEAGDGGVAVQCTAELKPDLVLMDLSMPKMSGIEAIREIKKKSPRTKILVLTIHHTEEHILAALKAGADGYALKDSTQGELLMAVKRVLQGKRYLSPGISEQVIDGYLEGRKDLKPRTSWDTLTGREREVLKLIAEGYKSKEIAEYLCISPKTVEKHRSNLMQKLNLHSSPALTALAIEKGLIGR